jgi:hypothetical protein
MRDIIRGMTLPFATELGYHYYHHPATGRYYRSDTHYEVRVWFPPRGRWVSGYLVMLPPARELVEIAGPKPLDDWRPSWAVMGGAW